MVKIVICDDMADQLLIIKKYVEEYRKINNLDIEIFTFRSPDDLLLTCESDKFHIYILDIVMPIISGVKVGQEIRRIDKDAIIIYASTEDSYALSAYSANPINYLIKPINKNELYSSLSFALDKVAISDERLIEIKTKCGLRVLKYSSIVFCEYSNHKITFILNDGSIESTLSIKDSFSTFIEPILEDSRFVKPHSSFLVNMSRVKSFSKEGFMMRNGCQIPISNKKYPDVRNKFMDYMLSRNGGV